MKSGKLTSKHQVTVPRDVREALGLKADDHVMTEIVDDQAVLSKIDYDEPSPKEWQRVIMARTSEWFDPEEDAYWADL